MAYLTGYSGAEWLTGLVTMGQMYLPYLTGYSGTRGLFGIVVVEQSGLLNW